MEAGWNRVRTVRSVRYYHMAGGRFIGGGGFQQGEDRVQGGYGTRTAVRYGKRTRRGRAVSERYLLLVSN